MHRFPGQKLEPKWLRENMSKIESFSQIGLQIKKKIFETTKKNGDFRGIPVLTSSPLSGQIQL